jgi:hypothetical protein
MIHHITRKASATRIEFRHLNYRAAGSSHDDAQISSARTLSQNKNSD